MRQRVAFPIVLATSFSLGLLTTACMQVAPIAAPRLNLREQAQEVTAPAAPDAAELTASSGAAATPRPSATARLGSISETLALTGRVTSADEASVRIQTSGRVDRVNVVVGQAVDAGQLLVELDAKDQAKELASVKSRLDVASLRLGQASQLSDQRLRDAEAEVRRAQFELGQVRSGAPASDRQAAEAAVLAARLGYERAMADQAKVASGPSDQDTRDVQQTVAAARAANDRAVAELARTKRGTDPVEAANAERDAATAQAALDRAQIDLDKLHRGADPADVAAAEREVDRARLALRSAQTQSASGSNGKAQRDIAIASAEATVRDAEARLDRARQGARADDLNLARRNVEVAKSTLSAAQQRVAQVRRGPDSSSVSAATAAAEQSRIALESAEQKLRTLQSGPTNDQLATATSAVETARASLASAQSRLDEMNRRGTGADVTRAEDRVATALSALERARTASTAAATPNSQDPSALDVILLQKEVRELQTQADTLERQVNDASPKAAFLGYVTSVLVREGDPVEPGQVIVSIAKSAAPVVVADVTDDQREKLSQGQAATVRVDGRDPFKTTLSSISVAGTGNRVARMNLDGGANAAGFGAVAQIDVTLQEKANVVIIPKKAVKTAGARRYVEQMDGLSKRLIDVQVGLTSGDDVEIVTGLAPGEVVLLPA